MEELCVEGLATHGDPSHASITREGVAKHGLVSMLGQWISASWTCPRRPAAGWLARSRRSECHQAWPSCQAGAGLHPDPAGQDRALWARRPSAGRVAGNPRPVAAIPSRVSQHQPGPVPSLPVAAYPARRHRAVIAGSRSGCTFSATASRSLGAPPCSPSEQEAVDVPLGQPNRPRVSAARRAGRSGGRNGVVGVCRHADISAFPASNRRPRLPRVLPNDALDVTILLPGPPRGYGLGAMIVSAPSQLRSVTLGPGGSEPAAQDRDGPGQGPRSGWRRSRCRRRARCAAARRGGCTTRAVAVGPDGQVGGDRDDGEFLRGGGDDAGDAAVGQGPGQRGPLRGPGAGGRGREQGRVRRVHLVLPRLWGARWVIWRGKIPVKGGREG